MDQSPSRHSVRDDVQATNYDTKLKSAIQSTGGPKK